MRVIYSPYLVVANIFLTHLRRQPLHRLIRFLRHRFLRLHLQHQVRPALQVQSQLDLMTEVILQLRQRGGEYRKTDQSVDAANYDQDNKNRFPLQVGIHG